MLVWLANMAGVELEARQQGIPGFAPGVVPAGAAETLSAAVPAAVAAGVCKESVSQALLTTDPPPSLTWPCQFCSQPVCLPVTLACGSSGAKVVCANKHPFEWDYLQFRPLSWLNSGPVTVECQGCGAKVSGSRVPAAKQPGEEADPTPVLPERCPLCGAYYPF
eukprot:TRINITY_DN32728_c0_g1_i1.p2 TRINITY_DN32728_c0_g1~~TRINITY_DN32728_c0_g1_i1.p2  ORF type:complete len:164 (-),score=12.49 TRINITY_DN32728_c0_g1_i1:41-532(-)